MNITLSDVGLSALEADGPVLVTGGPGSGKTTLALLKAQRQIASLEPGQEVLFLSFSRAAVRQVLLRCKDILTQTDRSEDLPRLLYGHPQESRSSPQREASNHPVPWS